MDSAVFAAVRRLDAIDTWAAVAQAAMVRLSGRTPPRLRAVFVEWPLVSTQMAERITGTHRATVQRNIDRMAARGLVREITGRARGRMWWIVDIVDRGQGARRPGSGGLADAFGG